MLVVLVLALAQIKGSPDRLFRVEAVACNNTRLAVVVAGIMVAVLAVITPTRMAVVVEVVVGTITHPTCQT
jgi:hypothetical protein